jgi:diguanylate cyclase (GGDEF)-like protein
MMDSAHSANAPARPRQFDDPLMARIDALLDKGFPLLKFPSELENQFLSDTMEARRRHFLISGLLALILYNGFLIGDYLMAPDVFDLAVRLRLLYFTPVSLLLIFLGTRTDWKIVRKLPPMAYEVIIVTIALFAAVTLAYILSETKSQYAHFYHVGFSVVVMYGNIVKRLRFWYAVVFSSALMAIHILGVLQVLDTFPSRLVWPIVSLVAATAMFSLVANYTMELDERRRYLLTLRERGVVRELSRTYERLQSLSHVDGLTGLYNRRHFQEHLQNVWGRAQYDKDVVGVMMIDIDQFKRYNDRHGHAAGDECLTQIAEVLQATLRRPEDLSARHGGEEFVALMPHTDLPQAEQVAERVRQAVEALQIRHENSTASRFVTVSIGVACVRADFSLKEAVLISAADHALQQAKREGRNRVCLNDTPVVLAPSTA